MSEQKQEKTISQAVVRRLPRYYRFLGELKDRGITRISSGELSESMGITASQIRQDLNNFGGFGHQGYGYNVEYLHSVIGEILGLTRTYSIVIIGAGNLGSALAGYTNFRNRGFEIVALFDSDPSLIGTRINDIPVLDVEGVETFIKENAVDIAALALPKKDAREIADRLVAAGVPALWNFASLDLNYPEKDVIVENVHLSDSLMTLSYKLEHK